MKLIKPSYKIITKLDEESVKNMLLELERYGRVSHLSDPKTDGDPIVNATSFIKKWGIDANHQTILEAADLTVEFIIDRGVSHELVRHRLTSPMQESTRYCNYSQEKYGNQITFIIPEWLSVPEGEYLNLNSLLFYNFDTVPVPEGLVAWASAMFASENSYRVLTANGWKPEQARSVLPNSVKTNVNVKTNLREWRWIFIKRTHQTAHPQMREIMRPLLDELKSKIPVIFDDITY